MAKRFSGSGFAAAEDAMPCFASVRIVIADNAIAAPLAVPKHVCSNGAAPTAAISGVRKDGWTIATGNGSIGVADRRERA
jgi:hypothetical protein